MILLHSQLQNHVHEFEHETTKNNNDEEEYNKKDVQNDSNENVLKRCPLILKSHHRENNDDEGGDYRPSNQCMKLNNICNEMSNDGDNNKLNIIEQKTFQEKERKDKNWGTNYDITPFLKPLFLGYVVGRFQSFSLKEYHEFEERTVAILKLDDDDKWTYYCLISVFVVVVLVVFSFFLKCSYEFLINEKYQRRSMNNNEEKNFDDNITFYRKRINVGLGTVEAPSLVQTTTINHDLNNPLFEGKQHSSIILSYKNLTSFAEQHCELLQSIDRAIQITRMVSSIHLGLGPLSFTIERVEAASVRTKTSTPTTVTTMQKTRNGHINLKSLRQLIFLTLEKQAESISKIRDQHIQIQNEESKPENIIHEEEEDDICDDLFELIHEEDNFGEVTTTLPSKLFTLSLLKLARSYVSDLLSKTISNIATSATTITSENQNNNIESLLSSSISIMDELNVYLNSYLPSRDLIDKIQENSNNPEWRQLSQLQTHTDALNLSVWAYEKCVTEKSNKYMTEEKKVLWSRLSGIIRNISDIYNTLDDHLQRKETVEVEEDESNATIVNLSKTDKQCDTQEYDDNGQLLDQKTIKQDDQRTKDKTLVFSGRGSKTISKGTARKKNESSKHSSSMTLIQPLMFHRESAGRSILLRELQSRLEVLDVADELDITIDHGIDDIHKQGESLAPKMYGVKESRSKESKSSNIFLGVSGALLSELQCAISNNGDG